MLETRYTFTIKHSIGQISLVPVIILLLLSVFFCLKERNNFFNLLNFALLTTPTLISYLNFMFATYVVTPEEFLIKYPLFPSLRVPIVHITEIEVKNHPRKTTPKLLLRYRNGNKNGFYQLTPQQPSELLETIRKFNPSVKVI